MKRSDGFYKGEPSIIEIEKCLNNVQKYLSEGNIKKAEGGIKGLWHAITELAESIRVSIEDAEEEAVIVQKEIQKDDYWYSQYTAETAMENTLSILRDISPRFVTRAKVKHEETWTWEKLEKAWQFAREKTIEEWGKDYADRGIEGVKIAREMFGYALSDFPYGAKIEYPTHGGLTLIFPTYTKEASDDLGACREYVEKYFGEYFGKHVNIFEIPSYR